MGPESTLLDTTTDSSNSLSSKLAMVTLEGEDQHFILEPVESLLEDKGTLVESELAHSQIGWQVYSSSSELHERAHLFGGK